MRKALKGEKWKSHFLNINSTALVSELAQIINTNTPHFQGAHWAGWLSGAFSDFQRHWHKRRSCWAVFIKFCNLQKVNSIRIYLWWIILAAKISERNFYLIWEWIIKPSLFSRKWPSSLWKGALHFENTHTRAEFLRRIYTRYRKPAD